ncbi:MULTISPECIES: response regulator transcription factor [Crossiella]|uniref:DNA-binding NarL/FixJ family response regulator n=1 Tax=Crossiella cryophila TaxID=43355 RepID=A0A7W7C7K4_9PSEU|nr:MULTISPECIES: response regulator transcription factor [Crossiella]MBB4676002.1 DNA-binding NarL/FixJ family response regulator [Crossiella cryophila]MCK2244048.1 response regulator transcription factor [Crossiella sp. S99.2]MCK2257094.1 response regulator transcription factor [Crossiella sp. S99.1]MCO1575922.1 response regulator transcription factor [Crossiella sp. SN42]WHT20548.1 response regulator transcription factor [Crossiella sp. CA-258035]
MTNTERVPVVLHATDAISRAGVAAALRSRPEVLLVDSLEARPDAVVLVVTDRTDTRTQQLLRGLQVRGNTKVVLIAGEMDDTDLLTAVETGVSAVVRRSEATPETLVRLVRAAAAGEGALPPDLLGRLLNRVSRLQRNVLRPNGMSLAGMSERETDVLRLVADGLDTREIAEQLCYSQRTVKSILHDITNRFQLRNRSHAVAFALREGLI